MTLCSLAWFNKIRFYFGSLAFVLWEFFSCRSRLGACSLWFPLGFPWTQLIECINKGQDAQEIFHMGINESEKWTQTHKHCIQNDSGTTEKHLIRVTWQHVAGLGKTYNVSCVFSMCCFIASPFIFPFTQVCAAICLCYVGGCHKSDHWECVSVCTYVCVCISGLKQEWYH